MWVRYSMRPVGQGVEGQAARARCHRRVRVGRLCGENWREELPMELPDARRSSRGIAGTDLLAGSYSDLTDGYAVKYPTRTRSPVSEATARLRFILWGRGLAATTKFAPSRPGPDHFLSSSHDYYASLHSAGFRCGCIHDCSCAEPIDGQNDGWPPPLRTCSTLA